MTYSKLFFLTLTKYVGTICLSIPVITASVERFSQMKLIKTRLRSTLNDSNLMKIPLEFPVELTDSHLEEMVDVWNRKSSLGELDTM